jgi:hypothetical protein
MPRMANPRRTFYDDLGLRPDASSVEIDRAYRTFRKKMDDVTGGARSAAGSAGENRIRNTFRSREARGIRRAAGRPAVRGEAVQGRAGCRGRHRHRGRDCGRILPAAAIRAPGRRRRHPGCRGAHPQGGTRREPRGLHGPERKGGAARHRIRHRRRHRGDRVQRHRPDIHSHAYRGIAARACEVGPMRTTRSVSASSRRAVSAARRLRWRPRTRRPATRST